MKYLLDKKAACLFVGETQCDTCAVRGKMDTEDLLLARTITNELRYPWTSTITLHIYSQPCLIFLELKYVWYISKYLIQQLRANRKVYITVQ